YVAAPLSTVDLATPSGDAIPIEERRPEEILTVGGVPIAPAQIAVRNPAFDITPHTLVTAIITEAGVIRPPYKEGLRRAVPARAARLVAAAGDPRPLPRPQRVLRHPLVLPRRADHRQQPDGRAPRLGAHLQGPLLPVPHHARPPAAVPEWIRRSGPVGRGRSG